MKQIFSNIEDTPFSNTEACSILGMSGICLDRALKHSLIRQSIGIHYRSNIFFNFLNIFDIFEYALRRNLSLLNHGTNSEVNELIYSLVDEMAFCIDNNIYDSSCSQMECIKRDLEIVCRTDATEWKAYWLYDGESFSAAKCSTVALQTWCEVYRKASSLIGLNGWASTYNKSSPESHNRMLISSATTDQ